MAALYSLGQGPYMHNVAYTNNISEENKLNTVALAPSTVIVSNQEVVLFLKIFQKHFKLPKYFEPMTPN